MFIIAGSSLALALLVSGPAPQHPAHIGGVGYEAPAADVDAVRQTAFDYIDAIYKTDPSRIERSVHPELSKVGYWVARDGSWREGRMSYAQLLEVARTWNADGKTLRADAPRDVTVFEVLDKTASAKVVAQWGLDYLQLAKIDGRWTIVNIVW